MKSRISWLMLLVLLAALAFPGIALASSPTAPPREDKVVFGGTYTLARGENLNGNLAVFGGSAIVETDAQVNGDIVLAGGSLDIDGNVNGNISAVGGSLILNDHARVSGDVSTLGATLHRSASAVIEGKVVNGLQAPLQVDIQDNPATIAPLQGLKPLVDVLWFFFRTIALAALATLVVLFLPRPTERVTQAVIREPLISGGLGLLTAIVAPIVLLVLAITILLIPVSLLGILALLIAGLYGWIAMGMETGIRISHLFKGEWALPVSAGVGTFVMSLVAGIIGFIPCVGWLVSALIVIFGLGGVILSRFGTSAYPPGSMIGPVPPAPPVMPAIHTTGQPVSPAVTPPSSIPARDAGEQPGPENEGL